ncbi:putative spx domain-containing protein [Erysiphe neolycopersici]|uniref:Putative spx domain-containing protein n=1 Tax=Erysiphe neolycopersici TaxID=212602 RepID=A0A420HY27_9PEZI|nr:putative spx domain-containing protein [Erysiphe neolycopersici]
MKYGQIFRAQSAPQWAPYNVDYDELKNIIKVHTTKNHSQAITIPGHEDELFQQFEKLFYEELSNQHDRVDLFVKSKVDEINSRLHKNKDYSLDSRCWDRFIRCERHIERCGEEIRNLKKFINAQRVAFHKILKKYTKWTSSRALTELFYDEILNNPKSFLRRDLDPLISQYISLLRNLRTAIPDPDKFKDENNTRPVSQQNFSKVQTESRPQYTYWNEYDNGSEAEEEPYLVYIDPNSESFPGAKTLASIFSKAKRPVNKIREWLTPVSSSGEQRSLLHKNDRLYDQKTTIGTEGILEDCASSSDMENGYSTFYNATILNFNKQILDSKHNSFLIHTIIGCYAASLTILLIVWLLATTGKKKLRMEVDAGVAIGVIASLLFAIIGLCLVHFRRQKLRQAKRYCAFVTFILTLLLNSMILIRVIGNY